jgi:NB-ARC domain-containing protein
VRLAERHDGVVFVADDLAAWLVGLLADAGRKKLTGLVLGTEQERALRAAGAVAVQLTAGELCSGDAEQTDHLALIISQVFGVPVPTVPLAGNATVLEALQTGIAEQLAVLDDASRTGTDRSSAEVLGMAGAVVAQKLTGHLVREIVVRGSRGGPLFPLASQLNDDVTHLQGERIEAALDQLAGEVREALSRLDTTGAVAAVLVRQQPGDRAIGGPGPEKSAVLRRLKIPSPPVQFQDRGERDLIEGLLQSGVVRVAAHGLPGVGKTALAAKVAERVRDGQVPLAGGLRGVLWGQFGPAPDAVSVLRRWCQDLGVAVPAVTGDPNEQAGQLRDLLRPALAGCSWLLVLDDAGASKADLAAAEQCVIDVDGSETSCQYLVTTISRRAALHFAVDIDNVVHVDQLDDEHAGKLLERYADRMITLAALSENDRMRLLQLGGGLPLSLMVLGRLLGDGLGDGDTLPQLLDRLYDAELQLRAEVARGGEDRPLIETILLARWNALPGEVQEALQAAAVFREKPHVFPEAAWAAVLAARRAASPDVAETIGEEAAQRQGPAEASDSAAGLELTDEPAARQACEEVPGIRRELIRIGLLEPGPVGQRFTLHYLITAFLRTSTGLDPDRLKTLHFDAAGFYRGWLDGFQESRASSAFQGAFRFENWRWLDAMADLCYHLRETGDEDRALLLLTTLFFDVFGWAAWYVPDPACKELLRLWNLTQLGSEAAECLQQLHRFMAAYPVIDLERAPPGDPRALPADYDKTGRGDFPAVEAAVTAIRKRFLDGPASQDPSAQADLQRLHMNTADFLGESYRYRGQLDQAASWYDEELTLTIELGEDDEWAIPYVRAQAAQVQIARGDIEGALATCRQAAAEAAGDLLAEDLDHEDLDHEALASIWRVAADGHWIAGRHAEAWRSHAWACFHACAAQLWPCYLVQHEGQARKEFGVSDYTVTFYKEQLARMLDRLGELWASQRREEARDGIRRIRATLRGEQDPGSQDPAGDGLDRLAKVRPEAAWEECRRTAWEYTTLPDPLVPWERLPDDTDRDDQRQEATGLAQELKAIWASSRWGLEQGPGGPS